MSPEPIDVERLHGALARVLRGSFGTEHVEDERREVEQIAQEYDRSAPPTEPEPES